MGERDDCDARYIQSLEAEFDRVLAERVLAERVQADAKLGALRDELEAIKRTRAQERDYAEVCYENQKLRDEVHRQNNVLTALTLERDARQWKPVESAPKDKDLELLVFCSDTREQFVAYQRLMDGRWTYAKGLFGEVICRPTHWMPLPASPDSAAQEGG